MTSQNSEPMETSMQQSPHPSAMQMSSENAELDPANPAS